MRSLLVRLLLIVSVALIPVLGFQVYTESETRQIRRQLVQDEALRLMSLFAAAQGRIAESAEEVLNTLNAAPALRENLPDICHRLLSNLLQQSRRYLSAAVIGPDGHMRCAPGALDSGADLSDRAYFRRALQTGGFVIGDYAIDDTSGKPSIHMTKPFRLQDGTIGGVVVVALDLAWLERQFEGHDLPPGAVATIVDRDGTVLARYPDGGRFVGRPVPAEERFIIAGSKNAVTTMTRPDGRPFIVAYSPVDAEPKGWVVAVGLDPEVTFATLMRANRTGFWLIFAGGGLALVLTALLGLRLIHRPVEQLLTVAERWRAGDLPARSGLAAQAGEFGRLAAAFDRMAQAHEDRERALRTALESTTDSVMVLDRAGRVTFLNGHALAQIAREQELLGQVFWDVLPRLVESPFGDACRKAMDTGLPAHAEGYSATFDKHFDAWVYPSSEGITVFFRDVTEERRTAAALQASEQSFRATFEQAAVGMAHVGPDGAWLRVNDRLCAITGYARDELLARTFQDITHPDDLDADLAQVDALLAGNITTYAMEKRYLRKDGDVVWVNLTVSLLRASGGEPDRFISVIEDISGRKRMEAALQVSEARLRAVLEQIPAAVAIRERPDGTVAMRSRYSDVVFGAADAALQANPGLARHGAEHADGRPYAPAEYPSWRALQQGETIMAEPMLYRRTDGRLMDLEIYAAPVRDADDAIIASVVAAFDVSDRKRAERILAEANVTLEERVRAEVAAREAAQARAAHAERIQALGQLAGGIAHDFNNVLQTVSGAAALIERRPDDRASVRRFAGLVIEAAERGASVTRRMLAFGRRGDLRAERLEVPALLDGLRDILAHTLGTSIEIVTDVQARVPPCFADKGQLETALVNLATNARDAMPRGGRLLFAAASEAMPPDGPKHMAGLAPGRYVRLTVADTGMGMDAATLAHALEPFYTTKPLGVGTGLGLPMVKGFAEQSGGAFRITSMPGEGTRVTLWLPEADPAPVGTAAPDGAADVALHPAGNAAARLLVVDDEDLLREVLAAQLEDSGFGVLVAGNGKEALALLDAGEAVDALVTDLSMPGMDGIAVIRETQHRRPGLPAVLLTGYAGESTARALGDTGAAAFSLLRKPINTDELVARIQALLAASEGRMR
ncbi:Histidine kinase [Rhodovastum atsumiense]|uniref:histidine kinase n=1 Tax=Rhodovastum atsumiense TaxID=504468 RepID=A0A5M6INJ2_9PROT|nr:PAS domain S-box protein [Rhodovastum atsumiense]KAA5609821.1 PAS domain S-box protein [Rhodovastum atsumiense]CAH2603727.1 Histidine kinase [Rhodovastum atsumiense]